MRGLFGKGTIDAKGPIVYVKNDKGFYGVETDDGKRYEPIGLFSDFKEDGMRAKFKATRLKGPSPHGWGKPIDIFYLERIVKIGKQKP